MDSIDNVKKALTDLGEDLLKKEMIIKLDDPDTLDNPEDVANYAGLIQASIFFTVATENLVKSFKLYEQVLGEE